MAVNTSSLHGFYEHSGEAEGDLVRELVPVHGDFETVAEIDVYDFTSGSVEHEV